ncbi:hypothetical protein [Lysinibacillus fusiformis]|uniref:hypothetical protein n=1 Tax=Lysinibacillus fusiformis TaxID=28031 RepID=UPI0030B93793
MEAHGVNTNAIKVMAEVEIDTLNHTSDLIDFEILNKTTLVVTLCGVRRSNESNWYRRRKIDCIIKCT